MKKYLFLNIVLILWLTACSPVVSPPPDNQGSTSAEKCISPVVNLAFPREEASAPQNNEALLPMGWAEITTLPNELYDKVNDLSLELIRWQDNHDEIWVFSDQYAFIYRPDMATWVRGPIIPFAGAHRNVAMTEDGTIWYGSSDNRDPYLIYRYEESNGQFKSAVEKRGAFTSAYVVDLEVDHKGLLWLLVHESENNNDIVSLYSFDPVKSELLRHISDVVYSNIVIANDDSVYAMKTVDKLMHYFPATKQSETYDLPTDNDSAGNPVSLYLDGRSRLWVSDRGWFDFSSNENPLWFTIIRSPIFIDYIHPHGRYVWFRPEILLESSNGLLWFASSKGTVQLDPATGQWCLFTTYASQLLEDHNHNLWMLINGALYNYHLSLQ